MKQIKLSTWLQHSQLAMVSIANCSIRKCMLNGRYCADCHLQLKPPLLLMMIDWEPTFSNALTSMAPAAGKTNNKELSHWGRELETVGPWFLLTTLISNTKTQLIMTQGINIISPCVWLFSNDIDETITGLNQREQQFQRKILWFLWHV